MKRSGKVTRPSMSFGSGKHMAQMKSVSHELESIPAWQTLMEQEQDDLFFLQLSEHFIEHSLDQIKEKVFEERKITYFVDSFCDAWIRLVKWRWLPKDVSDNEADWIPDTEPVPPPKDAWLAKTDFSVDQEFKPIHLPKESKFTYDDLDSESSSSSGKSEYGECGMKRVSAPTKKKKNLKKKKKEIKKGDKDKKEEVPGEKLDVVFVPPDPGASSENQKKHELEFTYDTFKKSTMFEISHSSLNVVMPKCEFNLKCSDTEHPKYSRLSDNSAKSMANKNKQSLNSRSLTSMEGKAVKFATVKQGNIETEGGDNIATEQSLTMKKQSE